MSAPPSIVRLSCSGLMTIPGSTAIVYLSTVTLPVLGTTDTWQTQAQYVPARSLPDPPWPDPAEGPAAAPFGPGDERVSHPDASRTALSTPLSRRSSVCPSLNADVSKAARRR